VYDLDDRQPEQASGLREDEREVEPCALDDLVEQDVQSEVEVELGKTSGLQEPEVFLGRRRDMGSAGEACRPPERMALVLRKIRRGGTWGGPEGVPAWACWKVFI
jgi:hypothetical protein